MSKADARVDAYGEIDELNAWLGLVRAAGLDADLDEDVVRIQRDLFALGAWIADPDAAVAGRMAKTALGDADVARLESFIDRVEAETPPLRRFVLAGGAPCGAALHVARTVCRRTERRLVALDPGPSPVLLRYVNRLSDLLFALARLVNHRARVGEVEW